MSSASVISHSAISTACLKTMHAHTTTPLSDETSLNRIILLSKRLSSRKSDQKDFFSSLHSSSALNFVRFSSPFDFWSFPNFPLSQNKSSFNHYFIYNKKINSIRIEAWLWLTPPTRINHWGGGGVTKSKSENNRWSEMNDRFSQQSASNSLLLPNL